MSTCKGLQAGHKWSQVPQAFTPLCHGTTTSDGRQQEGVPGSLPVSFAIHYPLESKEPHFHPPPAHTAHEVPGDVMGVAQSSSDLWDVSTTERPVLMTSRIRFQRKRRALGSIPVVGSSYGTDGMLRQGSSWGNPATPCLPIAWAQLCFPAPWNSCGRASGRQLPPRALFHPGWLHTSLGPAPGIWD